MPLIFEHQHRTRRYRMPWGAAVGAVVGSVANNALSSNKNGGAGTSTTDKSPWVAAQPWITSNLAQGQALQQRYTDQPFSAEQQQAIKNIYGQSDYMRNLIPSLLGQMGHQQVGFDPSNPTAKPAAWDWNAGASGAPNLGQGSLSSAAASAPAAAPAQKTGDFVNLDVRNPALAEYGRVLSQNGVGMESTNSPATNAWLQGLQGAAGGAGYGTFKYGQGMPMPGTQQYRDMQEYLAYGGADPYGLYKQ